NARATPSAPPRPPPNAARSSPSPPTTSATRRSPSPPSSKATAPSSAWTSTPRAKTAPASPSKPSSPHSASNHLQSWGLPARRGRGRRHGAAVTEGFARSTPPVLLQNLLQPPHQRRRPRPVHVHRRQHPP